MIEDHNAAHWLEVRYLPELNAWFVVRTCDCHKNERVTHPLETKEQAERARYSMLETSH